MDALRCVRWPAEQVSRQHLGEIVKHRLALFAASAFALCACAQLDPDQPTATEANHQLAPVVAVRSDACDTLCTPPRRISGRAPIYPISKLLKGAGGEALIAFTVDVDGTTKDFVVISATYPYFGSHAIVAVKDWRFEPATKDGHPVAVRVTQLFQFRASM